MPMAAAIISVWTTHWLVWAIGETGIGFLCHRTSVGKDTYWPFFPVRILETKLLAFLQLSTCDVGIKMMPLHFSKVFLPLILHLSMRHEKRSCAVCVTPCVSPWTRQGLNLWPPDYEYLKVIFHDILLLWKCADNQHFTKLRFSLNIKKYP